MATAVLEPGQTRIAFVKPRDPTLREVLEWLVEQDERRFIPYELGWIDSLLWRVAVERKPLDHHDLAWVKSRYARLGSGLHMDRMNARP